jgi:hypothetical protein
MTSISTTPLRPQSEIETAVPLFDDWFDPIEANLRDRAREFMQAMFEAELEETLARSRYARRVKPSSDDSEAATRRRPLLVASCVGFALLGYPFFLLGSSGRADLAFLAQFLMVALLSLYAGSCPAAYAELFPTRVRYTALSIGYNVAVAIFGGFAPFIVTWLIRETGNQLAPAFYVIAAAVITLVIPIRFRETAFSPLK